MDVSCFWNNDYGLRPQTRRLRPQLWVRFGVVWSGWLDRLFSLRASRVWLMVFLGGSILGAPWLRFFTAQRLGKVRFFGYALAAALNGGDGSAGENPKQSGTIASKVTRPI